VLSAIDNADGKGLLEKSLIECRGSRRLPFNLLTGHPSEDLRERINPMWKLINIFLIFCLFGACSVLQKKVDEKNTIISKTEPDPAQDSLQVEKRNIYNLTKEEIVVIDNYRLLKDHNVIYQKQTTSKENSVENNFYYPYPLSEKELGILNSYRFYQNMKDFNQNMDSISKLGECSLVSLPFSYDKFHNRELVIKHSSICEIQLYNRIHFYPLLSEFHSHICRDSSNLDTTFFNFKYARIKLPDIFSYKAYIVADTLGYIYGVLPKGPSYFDHGVLPINPNIDCNYFPYWTGGPYLILNDTLNAVTKIISLAHPSPSRIDNPEFRTFIIDEKFKVIITNYYIEIDEYGYPFNKPKPAVDNQLISIMPDGTLQFSTQTIKE
jgi:hypothetical protein